MCLIIVSSLGHQPTYEAFPGRLLDHYRKKSKDNGIQTTQVAHFSI